MKWVHVTVYRLGIMLTCYRLIASTRFKLQKRYLSKDSVVVKVKYGKHEITKIRNIGILAHIDAGKTTTTERMLYYSGLIKCMGEVHHGNTVTDYMDQERERGITITSAAVTFNWKNYRINLIDTPGHIDFTMEVEQTLRVLDGAVVILDGSAGVEAQTLTVCRQADKYDIPRIIYVNKMDRPGADFDMNLESIRSKLNIETLPTQLPIKSKGILQGIVDVICLEKLIFETKQMGMTVVRSKLSESEDKDLWETAMEKRRSLTDKLSSIDDKLADTIIEQESLDAVPAQLLHDSIWRSTISRKGVPVLLGSSYKNIGVQPLMDAVLLYLPSPNENKYLTYYNCFDKNLSARVFKVIHDKQKGPLTFLRVYTGNVEKNSIVYNIHKRQKEHINKLYIAYADEYAEVPKVEPGNITAVAGLKTSRTGDLITFNQTATIEARKKLESLKDINQDVVDDFFVANRKSLEPVFFCSIEAPSLSTQSALEIALKQLEREDPSLKVTHNDETGQIVLAGMGELHIEIVKERIRTEYKIDVDVGPLQIAYRETIMKFVKDTYTCKYNIAGVDHKVKLIMSIIPNHDGDVKLLLDKSVDSRFNVESISIKSMAAIKTGVNAVLLNGPKLGCPLVNMGVKLHWFEVGRGTLPSIITSAVAQCIKHLMRDAEVKLLEPIMRLEVVVSDEYSSVVLKDLGKRRAEVKFIDIRGNNKVINCFAPLAELLGYSRAVRVISSGHATFSLEFDHYRIMDSVDEQEAVKKVTGFG